MNQEFSLYLNPTAIIDSDHQRIRSYAETTIGKSTDPAEQASKLFTAVRDDIRYDPYAPFYLPEHYQASKVLERGQGFCIPKASLLCALGRACGIPSRVGFAVVRSHLATKQLIEFMGSNVFMYHAFVEFYLNEKWLKATPAFNRELCERHKVAPLEFNGTEDALFQLYNSENQKYMEYVKYLGTYADIPVAEIVASWEKTYGKERVRGWIKMHEEKAGRSFADFEKEDVWTE